MFYKTRKATPDDRDELYGLYSLVLKPYIDDIWGWDEKWQNSDFRDHYDPQNIMVAVVQGQVVGYMHIEVRDEILHIRMMCVHPDYQRQGIGSGLLEAFLQKCTKKRQEVTLNVFLINTDARKLYEKYDFKVYGEKETSYLMRWKA